MLSTKLLVPSTRTKLKEINYPQVLPSCCPYGGVFTHAALVFPSIKIFWLTLGSQLVNNAKTNCSNLAVDTRRSTERLKDPLALWSAVSNLTFKELCYMWLGDNGEAVRRGRGNNVQQGKNTSKLYIV
jgi:hypothetical protein